MFGNYFRKRRMSERYRDPFIFALLTILKILTVCIAISLIILFIKIMRDQYKEIDDIIGLAFGSLCLFHLIIYNSILGRDPYE